MVFTERTTIPGNLIREVTWQNGIKVRLVGSMVRRRNYKEQQLNHSTTVDIFCAADHPYHFNIILLRVILHAPEAWPLTKTEKQNVSSDKRSDGIPDV
ncbi:unnamed protein product [Gongylonema pulchrum]|uniref:DUF5641 domain-containing protein n=1 Tax=Gongylonema pulchrum TaxID=637853 RepID=A0A183DIQ3_9BILA|nr:unnamed protein product [Gongylonema pulchrum]